MAQKRMKKVQQTLKLREMTLLLLREKYVFVGAE
jgi:hypothetical protein